MTCQGLAHWGNSQITGRGLVCLAGKGQIYQIALKTGEEYIVHPSNVVGYAMMRQGPQPYRFKSSSLRLQVPSVRPFLPSVKFFDSMRQSQTWRAIAQGLFTARTWARRTIWGDRVSRGATVERDRLLTDGYSSSCASRDQPTFYCSHEAGG